MKYPFNILHAQISLIWYVVSAYARVVDSLLLYFAFIFKVASSHSIKLNPSIDVTIIKKDQVASIFKNPHVLNVLFPIALLTKHCKKNILDFLTHD